MQYIKHLLPILFLGFSLALSAQQPLLKGTVTYNMYGKGTPDTILNHLYFEGHLGATELTVSGQGYHTIYDFKKDSMTMALLNEGDTVVVGMSLSESLMNNHQQMPFTVKMKKETKVILGYPCTKFEAKSTHDGNKVLIEGWVTDQIQTQTRIMMDKTLATIGFPLEFSFKYPKAGKNGVLYYRAKSIEPTVKEGAFSLPKEDH